MSWWILPSVITVVMYSAVCVCLSTTKYDTIDGVVCTDNTIMLVAFGVATTLSIGMWMTLITSLIDHHA